MAYLFPEYLKYADTHEYIKQEGELLRLGISEFAVDQLGDIVFIEVETLGEDLNKNEVFGTVEAVKTVSDLFIPVSGKVLEFNSALEDNPELVNESPYEEGWIVKMEISNLDEISDLLDSKAYKSLIGQ